MPVTVTITLSVDDPTNPEIVVVKNVNFKDWNEADKLNKAQFEFYKQLASSRDKHKKAGTLTGDWEKLKLVDDAHDGITGGTRTFASIKQHRDEVKKTLEKVFKDHL